MERLRALHSFTARIVFREIHAQGAKPVRHLFADDHRFFFPTTLEYAACSRSPTLGPDFRRRFTPRGVSRNSSMNSAHIFGPPSLRSWARKFGKKLPPK
jgi:hypothetical protein